MIIHLHVQWMCSIKSAIPGWRRRIPIWTFCICRPPTVTCPFALSHSIGKYGCALPFQSSASSLNSCSAFAPSALKVARLLKNTTPSACRLRGA